MPENRWSIDEAWRWYRNFGWVIGCNFVPSYAVNQIEMWNEDTFNPAVIKRELTWAKDIGFNSVRIFLHDLVWSNDRDGFFSRIHTFLDIASRLKISVLPTIFDDCWHPDPLPGPQPDPLPGIHNSRWAQSPGIRVVSDEEKWAHLEAYIRDILTEFGNDKNIIIWDLYNENGNFFLPSLAKPQPLRTLLLAAVFISRLLPPNRPLSLLKKCFEWARSCSPKQPLTSPIWFNDSRLNKFLLTECDIITFHNYRNTDNLKKQITELKLSERPVICTEYMARTAGSLFETHLPVFRQEGVGCYSWGLAAGRTQTYLPWTPQKEEGEQELWFHDIFRKDGSPYRIEEIEAIKRAAGKLKQQEMP